MYCNQEDYITQSSNQLRPATDAQNGEIMYKVSSEQQERIANASYVVSYLAQKGFTVYFDCYEHTVKVDILTESYMETLQAIEAMKGRTDLYKSRNIKSKKSDDGSKYYWITYKF